MLTVCDCKLTAPASELRKIDCGLRLTALKLTICDCKMTDPTSELSKMHPLSAWAVHVIANLVPL